MIIDMRNTELRQHLEIAKPEEARVAKFNRITKLAGELPEN